MKKTIVVCDGVGCEKTAEMQFTHAVGRSTFRDVTIAGAHFDVCDGCFGKFAALIKPGERIEPQ